VHVRALDRVLDGGDAVAIHGALAALAAELVAHLAKEDSMIYPRLIAGNDAATSAAAQAVIDEFQNLSADWTALITETTPASIALDPAGFAARTRVLLGRLEGRVRRENELLYPQALRAAHIRLCA
jgi:iron-sulfur cluster repair protein YtfE (RIC family)